MIAGPWCKEVFPGMMGHAAGLNAALDRLPACICLALNHAQPHCADKAGLLSAFTPATAGFRKIGSGIQCAV